MFRNDIEKIREAAEAIINAVKPNSACRAESAAEAVALEKANIILSVLPKFRDLSRD